MLTERDIEESKIYVEKEFKKLAKRRKNILFL